MSATPGTMNSIGWAVKQLHDGIDGAQTQAAVARLAPTNVITKLNGLMVAHYRALPSFDEFGEGWLARSERRLKAAITAVPTTRNTDK